MADRLLEKDLVGLEIVFRVEDKMGLLKERDQTIVTLETEISEVLLQKHENKTGVQEDLPNYCLWVYLCDGLFDCQ